MTIQQQLRAVEYLRKAHDATMLARSIITRDLDISKPSVLRDIAFNLCNIEDCISLAKDVITAQDAKEVTRGQ